MGSPLGGGPREGPKGAGEGHICRPVAADRARV